MQPGESSLGEQSQNNEDGDNDDDNDGGGSGGGTSVESFPPTWNMVAADRSWHTNISLMTISPVYMKQRRWANTVGHTPCRRTVFLSDSRKPPVNMAW